MRPILKSILLGILTGLLLVVTFPRLDHHLLAWVALVPMLWVLHTQPTKNLLPSAYVMGIVFLSCLLYWILVIRWPAPLGYFIGMFIFSIIFVIWSLAAKKGLIPNPWVELLWPPIVWAAVEFISASGPWGFTWWHLGYSQYRNLWVAQMAEITGVYGISFLIVLFNNALVMMFLGKFRDSRARYLAPALLILVLGFGAIRYYGKFPDKEMTRISLVQGNIGQEDKLQALGDKLSAPSNEPSPITAEGIFEIHLIQSLKAVREQVDMIVWPETMFNSPFLEYEPYRTQIYKLAGDSSAYLLLGMYEYESEKVERNSVILISPDRKILGTYSKMHLVPLGEYVPFRRFFSRLGLKKWIDTAIYPLDLTPGKTPTVFQTSKGKLGVVICFESIIPGLSRRLTRQGAELLFVITNDAWFEYTPAADQHIAIAALRAIESRRWVVQCANTGISGFIDPRGRIVQRGGLMTREVVTYHAGYRSGLSFYVRFGDVFAWLCIGIVVAWLIGSIFYRRFAASYGVESDVIETRPLKRG